ncbi:MAG: hypothetical protein L3J75_17270 [Methylococcaceae bacterium]|nr:hypothetical protein [Methylococcaceae bacterium]
MKLKNKLPILVALVISSSLISYNSSANNTQSLSTEQKKNVETTKILSNFGNKNKERNKFSTIKFLSNLGKKIEKKGLISKKQLNRLEEIAKSPTLIPQLFIQNAILATGINFKTKEPVIFNTLTGSRVTPCANNNKINGLENTNSTCKTQAIPPNKALETALSINQPIEGTIVKNGKTIPATYIVSVRALYKGSHCTTIYILGYEFEVCIDVPHIE